MVFYMINSLFISKNKLNFISFLLLSSCLMSPVAQAMDEDSAESTRTKRQRDGGVDDSSVGDGQPPHKRHKNNQGSAQSIGQSFNENLPIEEQNALMKRANAGDSKAQDELMERNFHGKLHTEDEGDVIIEKFDFLLWPNIEENCYSNPYYAHTLIQLYDAITGDRDDIYYGDSLVDKNQVLDTGYHPFKLTKEKLESKFPNFFERIKNLAEKKDPIAQHNLGEMYFYGAWVEDNAESSLYWHEQAANQEIKNSKDRIPDILPEADLEEGIRVCKENINTYKQEMRNNIYSLATNYNDREAQAWMLDTLTKERPTLNRMIGYYHALNTLGDASTRIKLQELLADRAGREELIRKWQGPSQCVEDH